MLPCGYAPADSINYDTFSSSKLKTSILFKKTAQRQKRSQSLLYRNRSLKQFFGDIPAINDYSQVSNSQVIPKLAQNAKIKKDPDVNVHHKQAKHKDAVNDEYLIKNKDRLRSSKKQEKKQNTIKQQECRHKRNHIAYDEKLVDSTRSTQRIQTESSFYDPDAYNWRKVVSKQKDNRNDKGSINQKNRDKAAKNQKEMQNEYYASPKANQKNEFRKQSIVETKPQRNLIRSSSIESLQNRKKQHNLRPKVVKHIFQLRNLREKYLSLSLKKNLLFTFGI